MGSPGSNPARSPLVLADAASPLSPTHSRSGCGLELGVTAFLTWLARARQMQQVLGLVVRDKQLNILLHSELSSPAAAEAAEQSAAAVEAPSSSSSSTGGPLLRDELVRLLTTGACSLPAFQGLVPVHLEADAGGFREPAVRGAPAGGWQGSAAAAAFGPLLALTCARLLPPNTFGSVCNLQ